MWDRSYQTVPTVCNLLGANEKFTVEILFIIICLSNPCNPELPDVPDAILDNNFTLWHCQLCHILVTFKWQSNSQQETLYVICAMLAKTGRARKEIGGQNKEAYCDRKGVSGNFFSFLKVVSMHKCDNMSQCAKTFSTFSFLWGGLSYMHAKYAEKHSFCIFWHI